MRRLMPAATISSPLPRGSSKDYTFSNRSENAREREPLKPIIRNLFDTSPILPPDFCPLTSVRRGYGPSFDTFLTLPADAATHKS